MDVFHGQDHGLEEGRARLARLEGSDVELRRPRLLQPVLRHRLAVAVEHGEGTAPSGPARDSHPRPDLPVPGPQLQAPGHAALEGDGGRLVRAGEPVEDDGVAAGLPVISGFDFSAYAVQLLERGDLVPVDGDREAAGGDGLVVDLARDRCAEPRDPQSDDCERSGKATATDLIWTSPSRRAPEPVPTRGYASPLSPEPGPGRACRPPRWRCPRRRGRRT